MAEEKNVEKKVESARKYPHWPRYGVGIIVLLLGVLFVLGLFWNATHRYNRFGGPVAGVRYMRGPMHFGNMPFGYKGIASNITAVSGNTITVQGDNGVTQTVAVSANTYIQKGGVAVKITDLKVNDSVFIDGQTNDQDQIVARSIVVK